MIIAHTNHNVSYLPLPNRVEIVVSDEVCALSLARTAFLLPVFGDGSIMLANNLRRGTEISIEMPGGHVDPGETHIQAAVRETMEEVGCTVTDIRPVGFLRMISEGTVPLDWPYPHPLSYQQVYAGRVREVFPYVDNDECIAPKRTYLLAGLRPSVQIFGTRAREIFGTGGHE